MKPTLVRSLIAVAAVAACDGPSDPEGPPVPAPGPHFTVSPLPVEKIARITPIGFNNKPFPTPHTYWMTCDVFIILQGTRPCVLERLPVRAPGDGVVQQVVHAEDGELRIEGPPGLILTFGHVTPEPSLRVGSDVTAGQVVATMFDPHNIDFGVVNFGMEHAFVVPERYNASVLNAEHPIAQFPEPLRSELIARINSLSDPLGRVSYDVPGTASGGWFIEGSRDLDVLRFGNEHMLLLLGRWVEREETRIASFGQLDTGTSSGFLQFAVDPAAPSWEDITPASGVVALRLWPIGVDARPATDRPPRGTLLLQLVDDQTLRIEWFDTHDPVTEFTGAARVYER